LRESQRKEPRVISAREERERIERQIKRTVPSKYIPANEEGGAREEREEREERRSKTNQKVINKQSKSNQQVINK